jgi:hypothetical protein
VLFLTRKEIAFEALAVVREAHRFVAVARERKTEPEAVYGAAIKRELLRVVGAEHQLRDAKVGKGAQVRLARGLPMALLRHGLDAICHVGKGASPVLPVAGANAARDAQKLVRIGRALSGFGEQADKDGGEVQRLGGVLGPVTEHLYSLYAFASISISMSRFMSSAW